MVFMETERLRNPLINRPVIVAPNPPNPERAVAGPS